MQLSAPVQAEIESFQDDSDVDVESDGVHVFMRPMVIA